MPLASELLGELACRFRRPAQRRHRIPAFLRLDQRQQRRPQPGSTSAVFLRPPPERRTLPSGASPAASSSMPLRTVVSLFPAARATVRIPPCPGSGPRLPSADAAGVHLDAGTTPRTSRRVDHVPLPACPYHDNERSSVIKQHVDSLQVLTGGAESPNVSRPHPPIGHSTSAEG